MYKWVTNELIDLPIGKVICTGLNYVDHVHEFNNPIPKSPVLFIKPSTISFSPIFLSS